MTYLCCTGGIWAEDVVAGDLHQGYLEHIQPGRRRRRRTTTATHSSALRHKSAVVARWVTILAAVTLKSFLQHCAVVD